MKKILLFLIFVLFAVNITFAGEWIKSGDAWMYQDDNGDFVKDGEKSIDGKLYYFDEDGSMMTGLQKIGSGYYYLNEDGTPKAEPFVFNGVNYEVNPRGKIINISEAQFQALKDNVFAGNTYNASTELTWNLDIANNLLNKYPLSKRLLRLMLEIKVGQENLTTDKIDWAMASVQANFKEQAVKCAKEYLQIRNALGIPLDRNDLIDILKFELFAENEAKYGVEIAYNDTRSRDIEQLNGALLDEIAEIELAYEKEMRFEIYGIGTSVIAGNTEKYGLCIDDGTGGALKDYDKAMYEKRKLKGIEFAKKLCKEKWSISKGNLIERLKLEGYNSDIAQYVSNNSDINWPAQAFKTAMVIKIKNPDIDRESFEEELIGYGFTKGEANSTVQRTYDAYLGSNKLTDEEKIEKLMVSGFDRLEAEKVLKNITAAENEVIVVQTQSSRNNESSNVIGQGVVSAESANKEAKIIEMINNYMSQQTYSEKALQLKLQNEHNITLEEFKKIYKNMGINWKDITKKRAEEIIASGANNERLLKSQLDDEKFDDILIQKVIEELQAEGKLSN